MKLSFDKFLFGFSGYQLRQEGKYFYLIQVKLFEKIVFLSKKKFFMVAANLLSVERFSLIWRR